MADIVGTNATETLNGTDNPDTIEGLGGSDQIDGLDGGDTISGGDGADTIFGGDGDDTIYGHSAADLDPNSGDIVATLLANVGSGAVFVTGAPGDDGFVYALRKDVGDIVRIDTSTGAQSLFLDIPNSQFSSGGERENVLVDIVDLHHQRPFLLIDIQRAAHTHLAKLLIRAHKAKSQLPDFFWREIRIQ